MLQPLRFVMDLIPVELEYFHKEELPESMPPDDSEGLLLALLGQGYASVRRVVDHMLLCEALNHLCHRGRTDAQSLREQGCADLPALRLEIINALQVVLNMFAEHY